MRRCRHEWEDERTESVLGLLQEPPKARIEAERLPLDALYGWTVVQQRCKKCGEIAIRRFSGAFEG
jgi:hypothetical protein